MYVDEGALRPEGDHWVAVPDFAERVAVPASIEALLAARLDLLPPDELTVTESASVIGLSFQREPLDELVPASLGAVAEQLDRVEGKGLVTRPEEDPPELYRFHHIMIRDSAYNRLPKRARSRLHARFAGWAERVNRERGRELEFQEIVGYHLEQARRYLAELAPLDEEGRHLGRRAAGHLGPAGRRAFARGDMWAAANLLRRTADLFEPGDRGRLALLPDLGEALMEIGEFAEAQERLDEAVAAAASAGDTALEADAVLTRLLVAHHSVADLDAWRSEVQREADRVIPLLEAGEAPGVLAKAWRMVAFIHGTVCHWQETGDALEQALRSARAAGDARQVARLSASYVMALGEGPTPAPEAIARAEEVLALGLVDRQAEAVAVLALALLYAMSGDLVRARELCTRSGELLRDLGATVLAARTSYVSARVELMAGEAAAAEARLRADYDALTAMDERYFRPIIASLLAKSLYELDRPREAAELVAVTEEIASPDDVEAHAVARAVRAKLAAADGQPERARSLAWEAVELVAQTDAPVLRADVRLDAAEALAAVPEERARLLAEARDLYRRKQHLLGVARVEAELESAATVG
jgi:tetratricopeptide (TPR) repeat protein